MNGGGMKMNKPKDVKGKAKRNVNTDEFWYDPMNYPAFLKKRDDKTPLI